MLNKEKWRNHQALLDACLPFRNFEYEIASDPPIWVKVSGEPVFDNDQTFAGYIGTKTDITNQKREEQKLLESENRFKTLFEGSVQGIILYADDRALLLNRAIENILGYSADEIYGLEKLSRLCSEDYREQYIAYSNAISRGNSVPDIQEFDWIRKDGDIISVRQVSQVIDWEGNPAIQSTIIDITDQKRAEVAVNEHEQRIQLITDGLPMNIIYLDKDRRYRFVNKAFLNWYAEIDAEQILGRHLEDVMGTVAYEMIRAKIDAAFAGQQQNFEMRIPFVKAGTKLVQLIYIPHFDQQGLVQGIYCLIIDITERKQAEQTARDAETRFARMLAIAPDAIIAIDENSNIKVFNHGAEKVFGYTCAEAIGQPLNILLPSDFHDRHADYVKIFLEQEEDSRLMSERSEIYGVKKDGSKFAAEASISKLRIGDETIMTVLLHDISDRKQSESELIAAKEKAEYADRTKSEFLANMSHELRTPLNAIIGFAEMMAHKTFGELGDPRYEEYSNDIYKSGKHLLSLINDILDISKIEAGQLELHESEIDFKMLVADCRRLTDTRINVTSLEIHSNIEADLPNLWGDERLVKQMLINLLSNAIKFTEAGGKIEISGELTGDGKIKLSVTDTGIGIAKEDIPRAMATFGQVDGAMNKKFDGTGLGLPLVKSLTELHGGGLELESEIDVGTRATIWFPKERVIDN